MVLVPELERVDDKWKRTEMDGFACGSLGLHVSLPARFLSQDQDRSGEWMMRTIGFHLDKTRIVDPPDRVD